MNMSVLQEKFQSSPHLKKLVEQLSNAKSLTPTLSKGEGESQKIFLKNLQGSTTEFVVSAVFTNEQSS